MKKRIEKILEGIPGKLDNKGTISLKFKRELCEWVIQKEEFFKNKAAIELGTCNGYTTRILSSFFNKVITFEQIEERRELAKQFNSDKDNIEYRLQDIYNSDWWKVFDDVGLVFIDAMHTYECAKKDFENSLKLPYKEQLFIVFDDYGAFPEIKTVVDEAIEAGIIKFVKFMGQESGFTYKLGKSLEDREGLICVYEG